MVEKKRKFAALLVFALILVFSINIVSASDRDKVTYDEALANFRNVKAGKIGRNNLYRSQHPANGTNRSLLANVFLEENGIRTVLNLSDSKAGLDKLIKENIVGSAYYYKTLYKRGRVYPAGIIAYQNDAIYRNRITGGLKFFVKNKGPYLVHCKAGRDRTGMVILLLECLMGAPYSYMVEDYAQSYVNMNGYTRAEARNAAVLSVQEGLKFITGKIYITDWSKVNAAPYAEIFLKQGGMSAGEIAALKKNLAASFPSRGITFESICSADSLVR